MYVLLDYLLYSYNIYYKQVVIAMRIRPEIGCSLLLPTVTHVADVSKV